VAIVQISRITQRSGLQQDLPQLAGAEFGWSVDQRRLFIGNGTLEEGAPVVGNTEILTEFSDILAITASGYTYQGEAAGYPVQTGPTSGAPVNISVQSWMDQWATVLDFGAVGDGVTDCTDAINRALYEIYCRQTNPQIRRSLFFPGGIYKISGTIIIPTWATLVGEGAQNSVIQLSETALVDYVFQTGDSLQQTGANIGNGGATPPQSITITDLGFESLKSTASVGLFQDATDCVISRSRFVGPLGTADLVNEVAGSAGVRFASTAGLICSNIQFDHCVFGGTTWAINTDQGMTGVRVQNCSFDTLYQGIVLGAGGTVNPAFPLSGFRISASVFDNIYAQGIVFGEVQLSGSLSNTFLDVGNHFGGEGNPSTTVVDLRSANCVSVGDQFERSATNAAIRARINLANQASIAFTSGEQLAMGSYVRLTGQTVQLNNYQTSAVTLVEIDATASPTFLINYAIRRSDAYRTGTITVAAGSVANALNYSDDYMENTPTGVTLTVTQTGSVMQFQYTSTNTGFAPVINYSVSYLA
jgi:hypothetical protein